MEVKAIQPKAKTGEIPDGWAKVLLDTVAKRGSGHTPDKKHPEYWGGSINWVSLADSDKLDDLYIESTAATITPAGIANSSAVLHQAGTVILSRDAGVGKSAIMSVDMAVSQHFMVWDCGSRLDKYFLYYWLQAKKPEFERIANGTTIKTIGLPYFKALSIPLPPLVEQRAAAIALRDVDTLIGTLDAALAKKRDIKQAAMQQLLTGQKRLPGFRGKWEMVRFKTIYKRVFPKSPVSSSDGSKFGTYPLFVSGGENKKSDTALYSKTEALILSDGGVFSVRYFSGDFSVTDHCYVLALEENMRFYCFWLSLYRNELDIRTFKGSGLRNLDKVALGNIDVPLPSKEEQIDIAQVLSDMDTEIMALEQRRDKTRAIKQGMMQELLTGRIRLI